jgi:hypothetical protein
VAGWSAGPYIGGKILEWFQYDFLISWKVISLFAFSAAIGYFVLDTLLRLYKSKRDI